jgi:hypothetical protein
VHVRCTSHPDITTTEAVVFATSADDAREAAIAKMKDKRLAEVRAV